jgi:GNAT superfamily N-acetyltransferase
MTKPNDVQLRAAQRTDIPALCELLEALFTLETDFQPDRHKQARALQLLIDKANANNSTPACLVWLAELAGNVIGMCSVQVFISTAEGGEVGLVEDVVIDAAHRNQGIGHHMLLGLEQWAHARGLTRLQLLADTHNADAIAFYERHGWSRTQLLALRKTLNS